MRNALEAGMSLQEITEEFDVTLDQIKAVLHFATQSLEKEPAGANTCFCRILGLASWNDRR